MRVRLALALLLFSGVAAAAQLGDFRFRSRFGARFDSVQNEPPATEFIFARWQYSGGSGGWAHDYPAAEEHLNQVMNEATGVYVDRMSYRIVPIVSDEIFDYPFGYISEPGMMWLNELEVRNFREFVDRGGIVMMDDFDGPRHFQVMYQNLKRVFPEREMRVVTDTHPLLHTFYAIDSLYIQAPYMVSGAPVFYGVEDEWGNLSVLICYNNDVGDFWEWIDQPMYPLKPSTEALRLGINIVLYAMTH